MSLARTADSLRTLRVAATLSAALPGSFVDIGDPPVRATSDQLRTAIAHALGHRDADIVRDRLALIADTPVRLAVPAGTRDLGGGVYQPAATDAVRAVFVTTLPPCRAKAGVVAVTTADLPAHLAVDVDPCTAVTLVVCGGPAHPAVGRRLADFALDAAAACLADELIAGL